MPIDIYYYIVQVGTADSGPVGGIYGGRGPPLPPLESCGPQPQAPGGGVESWSPIGPYIIISPNDLFQDSTAPTSLQDPPRGVARAPP